MSDQERRPGSRGPMKRFTRSVDAPVTEDMEQKINCAALRCGISRAELVRQIFDAWLRQNPEAWQ